MNWLPQALFEVVKTLNEHPDADLIYSDEDKEVEEGTASTAFQAELFSRFADEY
ncbi:MAG: hypothetical protein LL057_09925 [Bifidobacterium breve]|nr:hypothetical protein [Bifidobacterium breve]